VVLETPYGIGAFAVPVGSAPPRAGLRYDVEFEFDGRIDTDTNSTVVRRVVPQILVRGPVTVLAGTVEHVDEDGMAYLRLGPDCLIMIDSVPGHVAAGDRVETGFPSHEIKAYFTGPS
jgi:hypothetical protein